MSSEESYLAILRYLTNEREPYAPGTEGNAKRKIRKAAACYVVRGGTLYYQRRQRDQQRFAELEVVLQAERRARLIRAAHLAPDGSHRTRLQTWQGLSQKYWWRGEQGAAGQPEKPHRREGRGRLAAEAAVPTAAAVRRRVAAAGGSGRELSLAGWRLGPRRLKACSLWVTPEQQHSL